MNIAELLTTKTFHNSTTSRLDTELLLAFSLNQSREFLYTYPKHELTTEQKKKFDLLYQRRLKGEPIAYILGKKEFWTFELTVNKNVLIPRPETELLVEVALNNLSNKTATVADLGTGSGAIAIALAWERPQWNIIATDISKAALKLARDNAMRLQLTNIEFHCGDWFQALPKKKLNMIISNPPYIANNDPHLQKNEMKFEPKIALVAGDGLTELQKIIIQAKEHLKKSGLLILEHGYNQSKKVQNVLQQNKYQKITRHKDLAGIYRVIATEKN